MEDFIFHSVHSYYFTAEQMRRNCFHYYNTQATCPIMAVMGKAQFSPQISLLGLDFIYFSLKADSCFPCFSGQF